jgi:hypothetical protein
LLLRIRAPVRARFTCFALGKDPQGEKDKLMPKNQFQRPQPINHSNNVPRHGLQPPQPQKLQAKPVLPANKTGLPSLEKLLNSEQRH